MTKVRALRASQPALVGRLNQCRLTMLTGSNQGSANAGTSAQPASGDQDVKMSDSASKGSKGPDSLSKPSEDDPMVVEVRSHSDKRERERTTMPEGKALKTSSAASALQETSPGRGANTLEPKSEEEHSSEEDEQARDGRGWL